MSELKQAIDILMERKKAVVESVMDEVKHPMFGASLDDSQARKMFMGTDVDAEEAIQSGSRMASLAIIGVVSGQVDASEAMIGMWIDGLMTGCVLKDLLSKKETQHDDETSQ